MTRDMPEVFVGDRGSGKTTWLIEKMVEDPNLIYVAPTMQQCEMARQMLEKKLGHSVDRKRFWRMGLEASIDFAHRSGHDFVVDEAGHVEKVWLYRPTAMAMTGVPVTADAKAAAQ